MTESAAESKPPDLDDFRSRVRTWLTANVRRAPDEEAARRHRYHPDRIAEGYAFHHRAWKAGFAGITCPVEYGGQGLSSQHQKIWDEEAALFELPPHGSGASLGVALPLLLAHGTEKLKLEHIPRILRAEVSWCQFLSESEAGSDLAGVRTTAALEGGDYVINGTKVWTSGAHFSQFALCLARTDPDVPKHRGLTMFVVPVPAPGVTIRPVRNITGGSDFNEVFLDQVRVPAENIVGSVGGGWRIAQAMLGLERRMLGNGSISGGALNAQPPVDLVELARRHGRAGEPVVRQLIADVWVHSLVAAETAARSHDDGFAGVPSVHIGSALKLLSEDVLTRQARASMSIAGPAGIAWPVDEPSGDRWGTAYLAARAVSIGGGTTEIQKNIVGERLLGLPPEPRSDRDLPFSSVPKSAQPRPPR